MIRKTDPGTSSAVAFILILTVIIITAGVAAAVILPAELQREAGEDAENARTALAETLFLMRESAESAQTLQLSFSTLLPKGTVTQEMHGYLVINEIHQTPLTGIALEAGGTVQGISSGIWRKDGDAAAWILFPKTAYESGTLSLELCVSSGDFVYGSTSLIPFRFACTGCRTQTFSGNPVTLTVISENSWVLDLWQDFFTETGFLYSEDLQVSTRRGTDRVTAAFSAKSGTLELQVREIFFETAAGEVV